KCQTKSEHRELFTNRPKCQTKSEHRELFTNRPKAIKRGRSAANDTQTWRERSERHTNVEFASISEICEIRGRYFGEAPNARSAKRKASTASFSPTGRRPSNVS